MSLKRLVARGDMSFDDVPKKASIVTSYIFKILSRISAWHSLRECMRRAYDII